MHWNLTEPDPSWPKPHFRVRFHVGSPVSWTLAHRPRLSMLSTVSSCTSHRLLWLDVVRYFGIFGPFEKKRHFADFASNSKHDLLAPWMVRIGLGHSCSGHCHGLCLGNPNCYSIVIRYPGIQSLSKLNNPKLALNTGTVNQHFSILSLPPWHWVASCRNAFSKTCSKPPIVKPGRIRDVPNLHSWSSSLVVDMSKQQTHQVR